MTRKGMFLVISGVLTATLGFGYITPARPRDSGSQLVLTDLLPLPAYGALFVAVGLLCVLGGLLRHLQIGAFAALTFLLIFWSLGYGLEWLIDGGRVWVLAVIFGAQGAATQIVAGLDEPRR